MSFSNNTLTECFKPNTVLAPSAAKPTKFFLYGMECSLKKCIISLYTPSAFPSLLSIKHKNSSLTS